MLLTTAVFLSAFGFLMWIVGTVFDMTAIAVIGGVIVVGVGASATVGSLETVTGEVESYNATTNETTVQQQTQPITTPAQLPLGPLIMIGGGLLVVHPFNRAAENASPGILP